MDTKTFRHEKAFGNGYRANFDAKNDVRRRFADARPDLNDTRQIIDTFREALPDIDEPYLPATDQMDLLNIGVDIVNLTILDKIAGKEDGEAGAYGTLVLSNILNQLHHNYDSYQNGILNALAALTGNIHEPTRREIEIETALGEFLSLTTLFAPHVNVYGELFKATRIPDSPRPHLAKDVIYHLTQEGLGLLGAFKDLECLQGDQDLKQRMQRQIAGSITEVDAALLFWSLIESRRVKGWVLPAGLLFNESFSKSSHGGLNTDLLFIRPEKNDMVGLQIKTFAALDVTKQYDPSAIFIVDGVVDLGNYQINTNGGNGGVTIYPGNMITIMHRILTGKNLPEDLRNPKVAHQNATTEQSARRERRRLQDQLLKRIEHSIIADAITKAA